MNLLKSVFIAVLLLAVSGAYGANATYTYDNDGGVYFSQMTAPETTQVMESRRDAQIVYQVLVAAINTNVVVRIEGSIDGSYYFNLDVNGANLTITANGTYALKSEARVKYTRFVWVSEAGGTNATLDVDYYGGAQ